MLKEKRILRDKYGNNHTNVLTDRYLNKPTNQFLIDPQETENLSPLSPYLPEPETFLSSETSGPTFQDGTELQECDQGSTQPDRICYPSLTLNSSDEELASSNNTQQTKSMF